MSLAASKHDLKIFHLSALGMKVVSPVETSGTIYRKAQRHMLEERNPKK
jgi:hypothetical protein